MSRRQQKRKEKQKKAMGFIQRKIFHICVNFSVAILVWFIPQDQLLLFAVVAFFLIFIGEIIRLKTRARKYVHDAVGPMLKNQEKKSFSGVFWMALAAVVVSLFAEPQAISFAFGILAFADPSAALVGKYVPSKRFYKKKSVTGSAAFFFVALATTTVFFCLTGCTDQLLSKALLISVILTFVEVFSPPLDDNFTILFAASILFMFLV